MSTIKKNEIVSEEELNQVYEEMLDKSKETGLDAYDTFIASCPVLPLEQKQGIEKHHIIPRFDKGPDTPENMIRLTVKKHVIAHWLRWKVLGKEGDRLAFLFRIGDTEELVALRRERVMQARQRDKVEKRGFSDPALQRELGYRGGPIGGSKNTEQQKQARQKVGLTYGRTVGIGNQGVRLKEFLQQNTLWAYSEKAASTPRTKDRSDEVFFFLEPKESFSDMVKVLNSFVLTSIKSPESMHKVVYGERKQMYGWRIENTLTRSEASEGIQEFERNNPGFFITFEND